LSVLSTIIAKQINLENDDCSVSSKSLIATETNKVQVVSVFVLHVWQFASVIDTAGNIQVVTISAGKGEF